MSHDEEQRQENQSENRDQAFQDLYLDGFSDACWGTSFLGCDPDSPYLRGYLKGLERTLGMEGMRLHIRWERDVEIQSGGGEF